MGNSGRDMRVSGRDMGVLGRDMTPSPRDMGVFTESSESAR